MRGRPPKPTEVHRAEGTLRPDRHSRTPVVVAGRKPLRPRTGLPKDVAKCFRELAKLGEAIWDQADSPLVEAAATALARARAAAADIERNGITITLTKVSRSGDEYEDVVPNPALRVERSAWDQFRHLADRLGIGPVARARMGNAGGQGRPAATEIPGIGEARQLRALAGGAA